MRSIARYLTLVLALGLFGFAPSTAAAKREDSFRYPFSRVWTSAIRLMRVDLECPITEKDRDEGYFFFDYEDSGSKYPGSIELITTQVDGLESVRVVVQVPAMPSYLEALILDRLSRKLQEDFGSPNEGKAKAPTGGPESAPGNTPDTAKGKAKTEAKPDENGKS
jgi:hypothetical protein